MLGFGEQDVLVLMSDARGWKRNSLAYINYINTTKHEYKNKKGMRTEISKKRMIMYIQKETGDETLQLQEKG